MGIIAGPADKENAEQTASVVAVEKEMQRLMDLQRHLLESVKDKLDLLEAKSMVPCVLQFKMKHGRLPGCLCCSDAIAINMSIEFS